MRMERLEHDLDMLTELVSTLVTALGENTTNVVLPIPSGIPLAIAEGGKAQPL